MSDNTKKSINLTDFQFIYDEAFRYARAYSDDSDIPLSAFLDNEPPLSHFSKISFLGEEVVIGGNANERFHIIAKRLIKPNKSKSKRNITNDRLVKFLKIEFSKLVLEGEGLLDESLCQRIIDRALQSAEKKLTKMTHYIPISFFGDYNNEEFEFGSVKVIPSNRIKEHYLENTTLYNELSSKVPYDRKDIHNHIKGHNAILCIDVPPCDEVISKQRALLVTKVFVGILHLISDRDNIKNIGVSKYSIEKNKFIKLYKESDEYKISMHVIFGGSHCDGWRDVLDPNKSNLMKIYASTINKILSPETHEVLNNRIIDAIIWYSEAISDKSMLSRILKYSTAIERLVTTSKTDVSRQVENRVSKLIAIFEGERELWRKRIEDMYSFRSDIVHGTYSLSNEVNLPSDKIFETIAQKAIHSATILFSQIGLEAKISPTQLSAKFEIIEGIPENQTSKGEA
ncbi:TPA: hypothetical protein ACSTLU_001856 [Serratia fonticola]